MNILITGGAGFLGSHLCDRLVADGHAVYCVDNLVTGSAGNIAHLREPRFRFIQHDISVPLDMPDPLAAVLHFASPASPPDYLKYPIETMRVGSLGTFHALDMARAKRARFLLASTSEIYGDPQVHPQPEEYWGHVNSIGPRSVYDEAKRFAEALTMAYRRQHALDTRIVRIFNTYGPRMRPQDGRAIPTFFSQALRRQPLTVFGAGRQTRSFCYVSDLVDGIVKLLHAERAEVVNLGNPEEYTILELAQRILALTGGTGAIKYQPLPQDDPRQRCPDITRAKQLLHWSPTISLADGLRQTMPWFQQQLQSVTD